MQFLFLCLFYSFIGSVAGFFVNMFNGAVQSNIVFDPKYITKTMDNFFKVLMVMLLVTFAVTGLVLIIPTWFLEWLGTDSVFFHQLVFYLFTFAAFDFGIKNSQN